MFNFLPHKRRAAVQTLLTSRVNNACMANLAPGQRNNTRSQFCEVVWVVPMGPAGQPEYSAGFPAVSKDISARGLALINNAPIDDPEFVIGLQSDTGPVFIRCSLEHCTPLGYGFYQIGLHPDNVVSISDEELSALMANVEQHQPEQSLV